MITLVEGNNLLDVQMVRLTVQTTLSGQVTDNLGPISGVKVTIGNLVTYTNSTGEYNLTLSPGTYVATFEKQGYQTAVY